MPHLTLINGIMAHPATDILGATIITATWWLLSNPVPQLPGDGSPNDLFIGLSTLSGLVMATATFICTMLYQSNSPLMIEARKRFPEELSRNWLSIIIWTLTTAILPLFSLCLWGIDRITSFGIVIFSTSLLLAKGGRSIYWCKLHALHGKSILNTLPCFAQSKKHPFMTTRFAPSRHAVGAAS